MLWPPAVISQLVVVIGQGDAVALGGTRCLPPAASTADFTASGLAPVSMQNALKAANRGGSCTCGTGGQDCDGRNQDMSKSAHLPHLEVCASPQGLHLSETSAAFYACFGHSFAGMPTIPTS